MAGNLVKPLLSLYGAEWRERGYGLRSKSFMRTFLTAACKQSRQRKANVKTTLCTIFVESNAKTNYGFSVPPCITWAIVSRSERISARFFVPARSAKASRLHDAISLENQQVSGLYTKPWFCLFETQFSLQKGLTKLPIILTSYSITMRTKL